MNKAQIGFHLVFIINSYAAKPVEKAGRRILLIMCLILQEISLKSSWWEGEGAGEGEGGGSREEEGRAPLPQLYERGTFGTFPSVRLIEGVRLIEVYKNCTMFFDD